MRKNIAIVALLALTITSLSGCKSANAEERTTNELMTPQVVELTNVSKGDIDRNLSYNGTLLAENTIHLIATVPGEILEIPVTVGDEIKKDQSLYVLDKKDIQRAASNATLSFQAATHQLNATADQQELAEKSFERVKALYESPSGSAISTADYEKAELAASKAGLEASRVQVAQARIGMEQANDQLDDADLKSPISGILSSLNIESGQMINPGTHVGDIINMDSVYVDIQVAESIINNLEKGSIIMAQVPAISSESILGTVEWVSPAADMQTKLFPVRISFDNKTHQLKPGMFVSVSIDINEASDSIIIPSTAILTRVDGQIVFISTEGHAEARPIVTGFDNGEYTVVLSGLNDGDQLVTEGQQFIDPGTPLVIDGGE